MPWHAGLGFGQRHGRRCQLACQLGPLAPSAPRCNFGHPFEHSAHDANCHAADRNATLQPALVRIRTALTEIEQAANRISPLLVYILEVTRGRYFAPKYSF